MATVTRTYTARLVGVDPELLWSHHEATCRAKGIVSDVFTALRAGVDPELVNPKLGAVGLQRQLLAALWFPVEYAADGSGVSLEPVAPGAIMDLFREELVECGLSRSELDDWLGDAEPALRMATRDNAVRVNRRGQLRRWCADWGVTPREALSDTAKLTLGRSWSDIVSRVLVKAERAAAHRAGDEEASAVDAVPELPSPSLNTLVSTWVSNRFGRGDTSNRKGKSQAASAIASIPVPSESISAPDLVAVAAKSLGVDPKLESVLHQVHTGGENGRAGGPRSRLYRRLTDLGQRVSPIDPEAVRDLVREAENEAAKQDSAATRGITPWSETLRDRVAHETGMTFERRNRVWKEIINGGVSRLVANTSWTVRQLATRHALEAECQRLRTALGPALVDQLDEWCQQRGEETGADGPVQLTARSTGSIEDVFAEFAECSDWRSGRDAVSAVQSRKGREFGDPAFFEWLATGGRAVWRDVSPKEAAKRVHRYTKLVKSRAQWEELRSPQLSHPDAIYAPHWSLFDCGSTNYQEYTLDKGTRDRAAVDATSFSIKLTLWDGQAWRKVSARVTSTYFLEQVQAHPDALTRYGIETSTTDGTPVPRLDPIARRVSVRTQDVLRVVAAGTKAATPTLQLKFDRTRHRRNGHRGIPGKWSVALATKVEPTSSNQDSTSRAPKRGEAPVGHRVLGVDLGLRSLAGWAVWEVVDNDEVANVAASAGKMLDERTCSLTKYTPDDAGPFRDHHVIYREIDGHQDGHWARLDAAGLLDVADGRKRSGKGVESGPKRLAPRPTERDWMLAARALKYAGARLSQPRQVPDDYRTSDLAFDYLRSLKRAIMRHGQLAGLAVAVANETDHERLVRRITGWWRSGAGEPRSALARLWASHVLPELPRQPEGELVEWRGHNGRKPHLPRPAVRDLRDYVDRLLVEAERRDALAARLHAAWDEEDERLRVPLRLARVVFSGGVVPAKLAKTIGMPAAGKNARGQSKEYEHPGAVTGLSPRRLRLLDELYKVKRSWHMRRRPHLPVDGDLEVEQQADGSYTAVWGPDVLARLVEKRDRVRDQLSKQVASAIVETAAANGCHTIAYENLDAYRTSLHRTRDENRKLRLWAHQSITKHLEEIATLHGFSCRAVNPRGTSQHSATTGERGVRVDKMPAHRFSDQCPAWWTSALTVARTRDRRGEARPIDEAVLATEPLLGELPPHGAVLVPRPGGEYFAPNWPPEGGIRLPDDVPVPLPNADTNAAANIALRQLGKWRKANRAG